MIPLYVVDPELAATETRVLTKLSSQRGLPKGIYGLLEYYCPDPACDCRRVMLNVVEKENPAQFLASINYAFDPDDEMAGPFLDPLNPQCEHAEEILDLVQRVVLIDADYVDRLERHYHLVKAAATEPDHPAYETLQALLEDDAPLLPQKKPARKQRRRS